MEKILIIGGTGFLGYHYAKYCLKKKFKIVSLSRNAPKQNRFLKNVEYEFADISKKKQTYKVLQKIIDIDYVINFGGEIEHKKIKKTIKTHYNGLKNLANYFVFKKIKKFIQIGSSLEYGKQKSPHKENLKLKPRSNYARAKALSSNYLLYLFQKKKLPVLIIRPYQVFGPRQDFKRFVPIIIMNCIKNEKFPCSKGNQYRDFLYIEDFVKYLFILMKKRNTTGEIFNLGYGKPQKIKSVINFIQKKISMGIPNFGEIKLRPEENIKTYPDISKLKKYTDFMPKTNFKSGLIKTIKFYQNKCK